MAGTLETPLGAPRAPETPVALTLHSPRTLGELSACARRVAAQAQPGEHWLLACQEPFAFAAGLWGLLHTGCAVALPPNFLPDTLAQLGSEVDGVLTEAPTCGAAAPHIAPITDGQITFWTSGSSGTPKAVTRRFAHLAQEVQVLESLFGHRFAGGPILGTVPHHHIYGLLFRILWPLATGRTFVSERCGDPDQFAAALDDGLPPPVLISSPAHLARLPHLVDMDRFRAHPSLVFSSGGALRPEDAHLWRRWTPAGITEIYGSTESGGIGWRCQTPDGANQAWTPFPDVTVAIDDDGALLLRGPRATLRMEDQADLLPDGRFNLGGRLDRVIKLEEKRISLPELEAALESHPAVNRAAVVLLEGPRPVLGALIVPVAGASTDHLPSELRTHLARRFEGAALPRRWRLASALPWDERGKCRAADLAALFEAAP